MADPRQVTPLQRSANHSPLMQAQSRASLGESVNFCPYGCGDGDLDENGYCHHLIGFSNDGATFEPMVRRGGDGRLVVHVRRKRRVVGRERGGVPVYQEGPPVPERVEPTDVLVKITTSYRVYRDVPAVEYTDDEQEVMSELREDELRRRDDRPPPPAANPYSVLKPPGG